MEDALDRRTVRQQGGVPTVGFYDVTSSYLEGACHALAAFGSNRDNKAGKTPIVIGLVTTGTGEPFAVQVFDGNTSDPLTVPAQVETLRTRFGITEGVCVGDRGMVKRTGKTVLAAAGSKSITALTPPPRCVNCCVRTSCVPSGLPRTSTKCSMARCAWCSAGARPCGARRRDAAPTR